ncbi:MULTISPECIES: fumarylacetoacetate hydrolase family protein [Halomonas]|uniref:fumarylacetoacetate hydrolase family protein n=1 Tax=Halomonas TaxID=2745 RepID=UPI000E5ADFC2|nr:MULTISPECIES: fumarylacetoacetate hydrolase family protein [Halomonas]AXY43781.1 FAA hydrolase family protein [Halomonas sp. JS92-SW72]
MSSPSFVIAAPEQATLPVKGSTQRFPVHRIYCVGRNFAAHAVEMGHDPDKEPPFFFQKSATTLIADDQDFPYPPATQDVHHEIEMVVALARGGVNIPVEEALEHVYGYAVGLDMTRRDIQAEMKKMGRPWDTAKSFEGAAPCGALVPAKTIGHPSSGAIWLKINGELRQQGDLDQMIWKVPEIISQLSSLFELRAGDLIMTGTPSGVGAVNKGDMLVGGVEGVGELHTRVVDPA